MMSLDDMDLFGSGMWCKGTDTAGEGCCLVATESSKIWVITGNDSSPENSSRLVRVCDASGTVMGYRVTPTPVLAIRMYKPENVSEEKAQIVIVTQLNIFIYDAGLEHCKTIIDTESNPHGAIAVSTQEPMRIAYPCPSTRGIKVATINGEELSLFHGTFANHIQLMTFSPSGKRLAVTDQDGLTVYSFTLPDIERGIQANTKTYRRGTQRCRMTSLDFSSLDEDILCCSSNHGTIHVFNINPSPSLLSMAGTVLWNFQIKDDHLTKPQSSPNHHLHLHQNTSPTSNHVNSSSSTLTSWCHFSTDSTHLYRVVDSRVFIYHLDLTSSQRGASLLLVKDLLPPRK